jgi:rare lipoprotein A
MLKMRAKMITVGLLGTAVLLPLDLAEADQLGHASWYALYSRTASGEMMNPSELTAAHRSLPFGTKVLVENLTNGRSVVVRINDRGPFIGGRIIDLSKAAAASIGMISSGTAKVRVTTAGSSPLETLGEATRAAAKVAASEQKSAEAKSVTSHTHDKAKSAGVRKPIKVKSTVAQRSPSAKRVAKRNVSGGKVTSALKGTRPVTRTAKSQAKTRVIAASKRTRTISQRHSRRSLALAGSVNPYAILGTTPGFMKPAQGLAG